MGFIIHPETGKRSAIHDHYPQMRQDGQSHDCLFCINADRCKKRMGIFFVGEKYTPCENYGGKRELTFEASRKADAERERQRAIKQVTVPAPRPPEVAQDCLYCKRLINHQICRDRYGGPWQGEGKICQEYFEVVERPMDKEENCIYCLINFYCDNSRVLKNGQPCEKYADIVAEESEQPTSE